eukprot:TRINITY_DN62303_c0_g1_i1.p1 TRINITY_DN62303_c0_g1~~TRINITY_DN62303_c0_g1_i1.p1  ORF type:complete len:504 (-),score=81.58 TRINITY_DN62303_c0_g1_i1:42-1553(-)
MTDLRDFSGELDAVMPGWCDEYQQWRRGGARGARGEHGNFKQHAGPSIHRRHSDSQMLSAPFSSTLRLTKQFSFKQSEDIGSRQTNWEASVNLLNNCLGVGILGMAYAISQTGILVGLGLTVCSVCLNGYTLLLHQKACKLIGCSAGGTELAEQMFGQVGRSTMVLLVVFFGFFCMVAMVSALTNSFTGILSLFLPASAIPSSRGCMVLSWATLLLPPTYIRSLKDVAPLSFVAFISCLVLVTMVIATCIVRLIERGLPAFHDIKFAPASYADFMQGLPTLLFMFSMQSCGAVVLATMKDTTSRNMTRVAVQSYCIVFSLDSLVGVLVYLCFLTETQADTTMNMTLPPPLTLPAVLGVVAVVAQVILLALSYMVMIIPCKLALIEMVFQKNEEFQEASWSQFYATTTAVNCAALATAMAVSNLTVLFVINGAVFTNLLAFVLPPMMFMKARASPLQRGRPVPMTSPTNFGYVLLLAVGIGLLCLCSKEAFGSLFENKQEAPAS